MGERARNSPKANGRMNTFLSYSDICKLYQMSEKMEDHISQLAPNRKRMRAKKGDKHSIYFFVLIQ